MDVEEMNVEDLFEDEALDWDEDDLEEEQEQVSLVGLKTKEYQSN